MGAAEKHISKYTTTYSELIPNTRILLIKGTLDGPLYPYSVQEKAIEPAAQSVRAVLNEQAEPCILVHLFSGGGTRTFTNLLHVLHRQLAKPLPMVGLIIDSAGTRGGFKQAYNGFQESLPKGIISKLFGPPVATIALLFLHASIALGRYDAPEKIEREAILNQNLINVRSSSGGKRVCYFASKKDKLIPWEDTADHADMAREMGWDVKIFVYEDTSHCNHMSGHEQEYKGAIKSMWMKSKL